MRRAAPPAAAGDDAPEAPRAEPELRLADTPGGVGEDEAARAGRLVAQVAAGDGLAFAELVDLYQHRIYAFCARMLGGDRSEAEDLAQDVFLSVYRNAGEFRGEASFTTWIYRIARNQTLNRIKYLERRGRSTRRSLEDVGEERLVHEARDPHEQVEGQQTSALVQSAIAQLPEQQRAVLVLRDIDGLAYEDITRITGLALGTVKSRLHRARGALAARLTKVLP